MPNLVYSVIAEVDENIHQGKRSVVFVDIDGVLANFDKYAKEHASSPDEDMKRHPLIYREMEPMPGAIAAVHALHEMGFDVRFVTKPPTGIPDAYAAKAEWIMKHFSHPENFWVRRLIITADKGILGNPEDFLVDDRPHKANCIEFGGNFMHFGAPVWPNWEIILHTLDYVAKIRKLNGNHPA